MSDTSLDLSILESLDFEFVQPCERPTHFSNEPAMFLIRRLYNHCEHNKYEYFCCLPCWERMGQGHKNITCHVCHEIISYAPGARDRVLKIIRVIGT